MQWQPKPCLLLSISYQLGPQNSGQEKKYGAISKRWNHFIFLPFANSVAVRFQRRNGQRAINVADGASFKTITLCNFALKHGLWLNQSWYCSLNQLHISLASIWIEHSTDLSSLTFGGNLVSSSLLMPSRCKVREEQGAPIRTAKLSSKAASWRRCYKADFGHLIWWKSNHLSLRIDLLTMVKKSQFSDTLEFRHVGQLKYKSIDPQSFYCFDHYLYRCVSSLWPRNLKRVNEISLECLVLSSSFFFKS